MTVTVETAPLVGPGVDRVDGPRKVTGAARYPSDFSFPNLAHAALVRSTIAAGTISGIATAAPASAPGVLAVLTHQNAPKLHRGKRNVMTPPPEPPLQTDEIDHYGQYVAVVVAETPQQASAAARLVEVAYDPGQALLSAQDPRAKPKSNPYLLDMQRGDVEAVMASAEVTVEGTFTTSEQAHNPIGLFATVAYWEDGTLTVHESTQNPFHVREVLASSFRLHEHDVRVLVPFVGGAFGAGLRVSPHTILAALAARMVQRPVKLVLTRPEMFTGLGHRPSTVQRVKVGATRDGALVAIDHEGTSTAAMGASLLGTNLLYPIPMGTVAAYACPNVSARDTRVPLNIPPVAHMRAPGEAEGNFALESILDELSYELGIDPIELRLRNYAEVHPQTGLPWSSKALRRCYEVGAERFGWSRRNPEPGSMREGRWLVGYGMAGVSYGHNQAKCEARATIRRDGTAYVCSGTTEIGVGTWTVMSQLAAELLGLPLERVEFDLGDTAMPRAPYVGGSGTTVGLGSAIHDACRKLVQAFLDTVGDDDRSPLSGRKLEDVVVDGGRILRAEDHTTGESYTDILARHGLDQLSADGDSSPPREEIGTQIKSLIVSKHSHLGRRLVGLSHARVPAGAFGARFVEVRVDPDLGLLRVARVVSAIDAGRVVNHKTARSQIIGGTVQGIGAAMFEEVLSDPGSGRIANATFGDYLVPVNADVPDMDVVFVGGPDTANPLGAKGVGEVGYVGIPAAIANAVHHATGRRVRSLPITIDQLL
jgi:xanthine dehydrogenase YagR molybdenum-binding subunit